MLDIPIYVILFGLKQILQQADILVFSADTSCWSNSVEGNHPFVLKISRLLNLCSHPLYLTQMPMSHKHSTQGSNIMQHITEESAEGGGGGERRGMGIKQSQKITANFSVM